MRIETKVRVARPTDHLEEIVRFYTEGLGLSRLDSFEDHDPWWTQPSRFLKRDFGGTRAGRDARDE